MAKTVKKRYWACTLYPESLPAEWMDILQQTGLPIALSPLHDRDLNPDGEVKKAHYHAILCYSGPTTFNSVKTLTDRLNAPIPIPLESVKGYYRYLTHTDNPEKAQYDKADIRCINGFNILDYADLTMSERSALVKTVQQYCIDHDVYEYCDLLDQLMVSDMPEAYSFATSNTLLFNSYIRSRNMKRQHERAEIERAQAVLRLNKQKEMASNDKRKS